MLLGVSGLSLKQPILPANLNAQVIRFIADIAFLR